MLETNVRIVRPGKTLYVWVRRLTVEGQDLSPDLLERLCGRMRHAYGIPAVRDPQHEGSLLAAAYRQLSPIAIRSEDFEITAKDTGNAAIRLNLSDTYGESLIPTIIERALLVRLAKLGDLWMLGSPRIWYESSPFASDDNIDVYRRFEVAARAIQDIGVGVIADISTAFFSKQTLEYYFDPTLSNSELAKRKAIFTSLTSRQKGQKGTLIYDNGQNKTTCYFEDAPLGLTCATTGELMVKAKKYPSLYEYYQQEYPSLRIDQSAPVARVSFPGLERPQNVAARLVKIRVMNENLPESLSSIDKISPQKRKQFLEEFWERLEPDPLGKIAPGLLPGFWQPDTPHAVYFTPSQILFGGGQVLAPPAQRNSVTFRSYYRSRLDLLEKAHCYYLNPSAPRNLHCVYPESLEEDAAYRLADEIVRLLSSWTGLSLTSTINSYKTLGEAYDKLRQHSTGGIVLFVLDDEPAAYYDTAYNLPMWRVKRVTHLVLATNYGYIVEGAWDRKLNRKTLNRGMQLWESFVTMNALDILQLMDMIPYRVEQAGQFEAQLVIDVGHDRRFFSLSILIARDEHKRPSFHIHTRTLRKPDWKHESINPVLLKDEIINLFKDMSGLHFDPLESLLILRDGRLQDTESVGLDGAIMHLRTTGMLADEARTDIVGVHKGTLNQIRMWETQKDGSVKNPLEGSGVIFSSNMVALTSTGEATLTQGTAEPIILVGNGGCVSLSDAALSVFEGAQMNWSSPRVAQRLTLPMKRTDEDLEARSDQEVRRIR